jgi:apolipoprotein N-acyltransferase
MMQKQISFFSACTVAGISGGLSVLGWTPWAWWPIAVLCYSVLFCLLRSELSFWRATGIGLSFGAGLHGLGHGWIFSTLHQKTGLGLTPAVLSTVIFVAYLAVFTGFSGGSFVWLKAREKSNVERLTATHRSKLQNKTSFSILFAAYFATALSAGEYARSLFFNGFTSLSLGYALIDTWFSGFAPMAGVYMVSWSGFAVAALIAIFIEGMSRNRLIVGISISLIAGIGWKIGGIEWTRPIGVPLSFRLLQANVPQNRKFDPNYALQQTLHLIHVIQQHAADLIVTPETAFPQFLGELPASALTDLQKFSDKDGSHLFLGIATIAADSNGHNSVVHVSPTTKEQIFSRVDTLTVHEKVRLMPFGEYSPWGFGWFTRSLAIPLKDLSPGPENQNPFHIGRQQVGSLICHEDLVGDEALRWVRQSPGTTIFINPSNLAWFEGSIAIEQRLQIVRMRALEVARPILRVANTGVTAHINHLGKVESRLAIEDESVLSGRVQGVDGLTPYGRWGQTLYLALTLLCFLIAVLLRRRRRAEFPSVR